MFHLFSDKKDNNIYAPVKGKCIDISKVADETFSSKVLGDGVAIIPEDNVVLSPCDGEIAILFPTKHAFAIRQKDGTELLVHIGIDTVNLQGKGFTACKRQGDRVKRGETIIRFDPRLMNDSYDLTTMVILTSNERAVQKPNIGSEVNLNSCIIERTK